MKEKLLTDPRFSIIEENLKRIHEGIGEAAAISGRNPAEVKLMAVTKTVEPKYINHAIACGIDLIGENKVQEFISKHDELLLDGCDVHLIGHLQTNKVRQIVGKIGMIQSVDSVKLSSEIGKRSQEIGIKTDILLEINIGGESSKSGFTPEEVAEAVYEISEFQGVRVRGIMSIPPFSCDNAKNQAFFSNIHRLFIDIGAKKIDNIVMDILSIGMSGDYKQAIMEGSTLVRVGSAIFGDRTY